MRVRRRALPSMQVSTWSTLLAQWSTAVGQRYQSTAVNGQRTGAAAGVSGCDSLRFISHSSSAAASCSATTDLCRAVQRSTEYGMF